MEETFKSRSPGRRWGCVGSLLLLTSGIAAATEAGELQSMTLDSLLDVEVSAASRFTQRLSDSPSTATVVTASEIRALGHRTLADVLRTVRGLDVNTDRSYAYLGVRGMSAPGDYNTRVLLLIDGNRVNDDVYDQAFLGDEFPLDIELIERVEFIPGAGSAVYGANAFYGVINVVTRQPGRGDRAEATVGAGSAGYRSASARLMRSGENGSQLLLSASTARRSGSELYYGQFDTPATNFGISPAQADAGQSKKLFGRWQDGRGLTATLLHSERGQGAPASAGAVFGDPATRVDDRYTQGSLQFAAKTDPATEITARLHATRYDYRGSYAIDYPPVTLNQDTAGSRTWGAELRALSTRLAGHQVVLGGEFQSTPQITQRNFDATNPPAVYLDDRRHGYRAALYAEDQFELAPKLTAVAGGRFDRSGQGSSGLSPRAALVYRPATEVVLKYIYGSAFRPANAYERFYVYGGPGGYKSNPDLGNEKVRGQEWAAEFHPRPDIRLTATTYANSARNLIVQRVDPIDGLLVFTNAGRLRTRGTELEAEWLSAAGTRLRANYAVQHADDDGTGVAAQSARQMANLVATVPVASALTVGWQTSAVSRRGTAAGYGRSSLTVSTDRPGQRWRASLSIYNLFNRRATDPGRDPLLVGTGSVPLDGRSVMARLELRY